MARHIHDRVNLASDRDLYREALVIVNDDPADRVSLSIGGLGMGFRVELTRAEARGLAALLAAAGEE